MSTVIGIDLGTTYSCVGVMQDGRVDIIANDQGNRTTPSWVAFNDTERLIGDAAKSQAAMNPKNTVYDAKRLIGRSFSDQTVQSDLQHYSYKVTADGKDRPVINVQYKEEDKTFYPEEISAMVAEIDTDGNGDIDFDEFVAVMSRKVNANYTSKDVKRAFKTFSLGQPNGYVSLKEVKEALMKHGTVKLDEEQVDPRGFASDVC